MLLRASAIHLIINQLINSLHLYISHLFILSVLNAYQQQGFQNQEITITFITFFIAKQ